MALPPLPAFAQEQQDAGNPSAIDPIPPQVPVEAFTARSEFGSAKLSPRGTRFGFIHRSGGQTSVVLVDAGTREPVHAIRVDEDYGLRWFSWAGEDRVLLSIETKQWFFGLPLPITQLLVFDIATQETSSIGFDYQGPEGDDVLYIDPYGRYIVLSVSEDWKSDPDVWRFPLDGSGAAGAVKIESRKKGIEEWFADSSGVVRLGVGWTMGKSAIVYYRSGPEDRFKRVAKIKQHDEANDYWNVLGIFEGRDTGYAIVQDPSGRQVLREFDYSTGEPGRLIHAQPGWDVDAVNLDGKQVLGITYTDDASRTVWFDEDMKRIQRELEQALPQSRIEIISRAGLERMLVLEHGPSDPGAIYVYDARARTLDLFANLRPQIDHTQMAVPHGVTYTARDGQSIRAYLTLPKGREPRGLPLVILPHGGPYGIRDTLRFEDWSQLLANRGYAVLQPNYRGSGGYGEAFETLGDGQIGRAMQDDLDDAMDWAVAEGIADPARVCLVGASYGGYAALWGVIRNPERYRCAASFAGVTDYDAQFKYSGKSLERRYRREWKHRLRGTGEGEIDLKEVSPAHQVARLVRPVLLAHGKKDSRVPFSQFEDMATAARDAGKEIELLELDDNHHLTKEENASEWLETLVEFLARHNPAD
ncbi:MAG: alpha/beta hydrolase family protein [Erythrobacter sp.]